jgi:hypothetical protein
LNSSRFHIGLAAASLSCACLSSCEKKQAASSTVPPAPAAPADPNNAWPRYEAIYNGLDEAFRTQVTMGDAAKPDTAYVAALTSHKAQVGELLMATKLPECRFGEPTGTAKDLIPPLETTKAMRSLLRILIADAHRCLTENDQVQFAFRTAAIIRMGNQEVLGARSTIDVLIAQMALDTGLDLVNSGLDMNMVPGVAKDELRSAIDALDRPDFLRAKELLRKDRAVMAKELRARSELGKGIASGKDWSQATLAEREATASAIERATTLEVAAWDQPDAVPAIEAVEKSLPREATDFEGAPAKLRENVARTHERLEKAMAKVGP